MSDFPMHQGTYDKDGNIVIPDEQIPEAPKRGEIPKEKAQKIVRWNAVSEEPKKAVASCSPIEKKTAPAKKTEHFVEGKAQLRSMIGDVRRGGRDFVESLLKLPGSLRLGIKAMWKIAATPVTLRGKRKQKTRTKGQLFFIDTVRFGGTFAAIFAVLFVGMNANSFWQIARAQLALGVDTETTEALEHLAVSRSIVDGPVSTDGPSYAASNVVRYLPEVGPPENRIVIPKLGINAPIVRPSMTSLLEKNWAGFEEDIQKALEDGIVHYPGSARPGQAGNFFLTGHSSYYPWAKGDYKEIFARLPELSVGDTYFVYHNGDKHMYRIASKYEVKPTDVSVLDQPTGKRLSTLMTCTPVGTTLRRLIVQAEEIDPSTGMPLAVGERLPANETSIFTGLSALPI